MNRRRALKSVAAAAAVAVAAPRSARAAGKEAATFLKRWNIAKEFTLKVAEVMPNESYDFKANPVEMGFGKLLTHLSAANTRYFQRIKGEAPPMKEPENADKETTKKFIAECFDWCANILGGMNDQAFDEMYKGSGTAAPVSGRDLVLNGFIHTAHHRAQCEVYLRVKNLVPPTYAV